MFPKRTPRGNKRAILLTLLVIILGSVLMFLWGLPRSISVARRITTSAAEELSSIYLSFICKNWLPPSEPTPTATLSPTVTLTPAATATPTPTPTVTPTPIVPDVSGSYHVKIVNPWDNCDTFDIPTGEDDMTIEQDGTKVTMTFSDGRQVSGEINEDLTFEASGTVPWSLGAPVCPCHWTLAGAFVLGEPITFSAEASVNFYNMGNPCQATFDILGTRTGP